MPEPSRAPNVLRRAPVRLALWVFGPMLILGIVGKLIEAPLASIESPGNPSALHAVKWMLMTLFTPSAWDDSWMPMFVALDTSHGPNAERVYETVFFERQIKFQYPPMSLLPLEPLRAWGLLEPRLLNGFNSLFILANAVAVAAIANVVFRRAAPGSADVEPLPDRRWMAALSFVAALSFYPLVQAHNLGQIQTLIDLLFSLACLGWLLERRALAGVAIGLACALKPQLGLFLPWALVFRQWHLAAGIATAILPVGLVSLWRYGLHNHLEYLAVLSHLGKHGESFQFNASMNGLMNRLLDNGCNICERGVPTAIPPYHPAVYLASTAATLVFLAIAFVPAWLRRREAPNELDLGAATLCFTMASPVAWYHHYGVMLPIFLFALQRTLVLPRSAERRGLLIALIVSWILSSNYLSFFNLLATTPLNVLQSHLYFGAILLLVVLLRLRASPGTVAVQSAGSGGSSGGAISAGSGPSPSSAFKNATI